MPPADDISPVQTRIVAVLVMLATMAGVWVGYDLSTSPRADPAPTKVAVVGDSYTEGTGVGGRDPGTNWTSQVVPLLREQGIEVSITAEGAGGSGYVATGSYNVTFEQLVSRVVTPDVALLVVFGSRNDTSHAGIEQQAAATYAAARAINPHIKLVVVGPEWVDEHVPDAVAKGRDEVRAAAVAAHAEFVDPLADGWFFGPDHALIGSDGWHPSDAGHLYMAQKIAPHMAEVLNRDW